MHANIEFVVDASVREQLILSAIVAVCGVEASSKNKLLDELAEMLITHNHTPLIFNHLDMTKNDEK